MKMPIKLGLALVVIVGLLFLFASFNTDKPVRLIEKPVVLNAGA